MPDVRELRSQLEAHLDEALTDDAIARASKKVKDALCDLEADFESSIKDYASYNLSAWVQHMAENAIDAMLKGDEATMRQYLHCADNQWTGRDREHSVIHGKLFETGPLELRKQIVDAHAELLKNERILDLEDQVKSLVSQLRKADSALEETRRLINEARDAF